MSQKGCFAAAGKQRSNNPSAGGERQFLPLPTLRCVEEGEIIEKVAKVVEVAKGNGGEGTKMAEAAKRHQKRLFLWWSVGGKEEEKEEEKEVNGENGPSGNGGDRGGGDSSIVEPLLATAPQIRKATTISLSTAATSHEAEIAGELGRDEEKNKKKKEKRQIENENENNTREEHQPNGFVVWWRSRAPLKRLNEGEAASSKRQRKTIGDFRKFCDPPSSGNRSMWNRRKTIGRSMVLSLLLLSGMFAIIDSLLGNNENSEEDEDMSKEDAKNYLDQFGYIGEPRKVDQGVGRAYDQQGEKTADHLLEDFSLDSLRSAIEKFQEFAGLPSTGELDNRTRKKMKQPRCGMQDVEMVRGRGTSRAMWQKQRVSYRLEQASGDLPTQSQKSSLQQAFDTWSQFIPLDFFEASAYERPDIRVRFARRSHGDPWAFDGKGGVLAHATFPTDGQLHFDDDEEWTFMDAAKIGSHRYTDLFWVSLHEIGHVLGLSHSNVDSAVMAPFYRDPEESVDWRGNYKTPQLTSDDIKAARDIYGARTRNNRPNKKVGKNVQNSGSGGGNGRYDDEGGGEEEGGEGFLDKLGKLFSSAESEDQSETDERDERRSGRRFSRNGADVRGKATSGVKSATIALLAILSTLWALIFV